VGRSRNYRTGIRKPIAPPTKVMRSKKDYKRNRHTEFQKKRKKRRKKNEG